MPTKLSIAQAFGTTPKQDEVDPAAAPTPIKFADRSKKETRKPVDIARFNGGETLRAPTSILTELDELANIHGTDITSGKRAAINYGAGKGSAHGKGLASDFRTKNMSRESGDTLIKDLESRGYWVNDERDNWSTVDPKTGKQRGTGPHIHAEWRGGVKVNEATADEPQQVAEVSKKVLSLKEAFGDEPVAKPTVAVTEKEDKGFFANSADAIASKGEEVWEHLSTRFQTLSGQLQPDDPNYNPATGLKGRKGLGDYKDDPFLDSRAIQLKKDRADNAIDMTEIQNPVKLLLNESLPANVLTAVSDKYENGYNRIMDARKVLMQESIIANPEKYPAVSVQAAKDAISARETKAGKGVTDIWRDLKKSAVENPGKFGKVLFNALMADPYMVLAPQGLGIKIAATTAKVATGAEVIGKTLARVDRIADAAITGAGVNVMIDAAAAAAKGEDQDAAALGVSAAIGAVASGFFGAFTKGKAAADKLKSGEVNADTLNDIADGVAAADNAAETIIETKGPIDQTLKHKFEEMAGVKFESDADLKKYLEIQRKEWKALFAERDLNGQFQKAKAEERMSRRQGWSEELDTITADRRAAEIEQAFAETQAAKSQRLSEDYDAALKARDEPEITDAHEKAVAENNLRESAAKLDSQEIFEATLEGDVPQIRNAMLRAAQRDEKLRVPKWQRGEIDPKLVARLGIGSLFAGTAFAVAPEEQKMQTAFAAGLMGLVIPGGGRVLSRMRQSGAVSMDGTITGAYSVGGRLVPEQMARDTAAIAAAKTGDQAAFKQLFQDHYPNLKRAAANKLRGVGGWLGMDADDLVQDAFGDVLTKLDNYKDGVPFSAYMHAVIDNKLKNAIRDANTLKGGREFKTVSMFAEKPGQSGDPGAGGSAADVGSMIEGDIEVKAASMDTPEGFAIQDEVAKNLPTFIKSLPEGQRKSFLLNRVEGLTAQEIADANGQSINSVLSDIARASKKMEEWAAKGYGAVREKSVANAAPLGKSADMVTVYHATSADNALKIKGGGLKGFTPNEMNKAVLEAHGITSSKEIIDTLDNYWMAEEPGFMDEPRGPYVTSSKARAEAIVKESSGEAFQNLSYELAGYVEEVLGDTNKAKAIRAKADDILKQPQEIMEFQVPRDRITGLYDEIPSGDLSTFDGDIVLKKRGRGRPRKEGGEVDQKVLLGLGATSATVAALMMVPPDKQKAAVISALLVSVGIASLAKAHGSSGALGKSLRNEIGAVNFKTHSEVFRDKMQGKFIDRAAGDDTITHPATFTQRFYPIFADIAAATGAKTVLDPFGGVGTIGKIKDFGYKGKVIANELEPEWASLQKEHGVDESIVGDARKMEAIEDGSVDMIITSPTYGNALAYPRLKGKVQDLTYANSIGRELTPGNSGRMAWGEPYRKLHEESYHEFFRVLPEGGTAVINVKDFINKGQVVPVTDFHIKAMEDAGFTLIEQRKVKTPGLAQGKVKRALVDAEDILVFQKPTLSNQDLNVRGPRNQAGSVDPKLLRIGAGATLGAGLGLYLTRGNEGDPDDPDDDKEWGDRGYSSPAMAAFFTAAAGAILFAPGGPGKAIRGITKDSVGVISTEILNISKPIFGLIQKTEQRIKRITHEHLVAVDPFLRKMDKLPKETANVLHRALMTGRPEVIEKLLQAIGDRDLIQSFDDVKATLKDLGDQLAALNRFKKNGKVEYFPRIVKDKEGLFKAIGKEESGRITDAIAKANIESLRKNGRPMSQIEESDLINNLLFLEKRSTRPGWSQDRGIQEITEKLQPFYANAAESLHTYIQSAVTDLEKARFFGRHAKNMKKGDLEFLDTDASVNNFIARQLDDGTISEEQAGRLGEILKTRFGKGDQAEPEIIRNIKNIGNAALLGNLWSTVAQGADIFLSVHLHDLAPTVEAIARQLTNKKFISVADLGLVDHISEEFATQLKTSKFVNKWLKLNLFTDMDALGKNNNLNAAVIKARGLAKTDAGVLKLANKYGEIFGDDFPKLVAELKSGKISDMTRQYAWMELSRSQPISKLEMPLNQLGNPNWRSLWWLKSFTIKQFDVIRRDGINEMQKGGTANIARGAKQLMTAATMMGLGGASTAMVKDWMLGKDREFQWGDIPLNMTRNLGFSAYTIDQFKGITAQEAREASERGESVRPRKAEPLVAIGKLAIPPYQMFESLIKGDPKSVRYLVPWVGPWVAEQIKKSESGELDE